MKKIFFIAASVFAITLYSTDAFAQGQVVVTNSDARPVPVKNVNTETNPVPVKVMNPQNNTQVKIPFSFQSPISSSIPGYGNITITAGQNEMKVIEFIIGNLQDGEGWVAFQIGNRKEIHIPPTATAAGGRQKTWMANCSIVIKNGETVSITIAPSIVPERHLFVSGYSMRM